MLQEFAKFCNTSAMIASYLYILINIVDGDKVVDLKTLDRTEAVTGLPLPQKGHFVFQARKVAPHECH